MTEETRQVYLCIKQAGKVESMAALSALADLDPRAVARAIARLKTLGAITTRRHGRRVSVEVATCH